MPFLPATNLNDSEITDSLSHSWYLHAHPPTEAAILILHYYIFMVADCYVSRQDYESSCTVGSNDNPKKQMEMGSEGEITYANRNIFNNDQQCEKEYRKITLYR